MPIKLNEREYRNFAIPLSRAAGDTEYRVDGYASTYEPYVLYTDSLGNAYSERIDEHAFDETDMSDVIFLYNHDGMVFARQSNGTLDVATDDHGLHVSADLSRTSAAREMYESIDAGMVTQMSFAFTVSEDSYDRDTRTRTIRKIRKLYDVSAVSLPANPGTDISAISARSWIDGVIEAEHAERRAREQRLALAKAKYFYDTIGVAKDDH